MITLTLAGLLGCQADTRPLESLNLQVGPHTAVVLSTKDTTKVAYRLDFSYYYIGNYKQWVNEVIVSRLLDSSLNRDINIIACYNTTYGEFKEVVYTKEDMSKFIARFEDDPIRLDVLKYFIDSVDAEWLAVTEVYFAKTKEYVESINSSALDTSYSSFHSLFNNLKTKGNVDECLRWLTVLQRVGFDHESWNHLDDHIPYISEIIDPNQKIDEAPGVMTDSMSNHKQ